MKCSEVNNHAIVKWVVRVQHCIAETLRGRAVVTNVTAIKEVEQAIPSARFCVACCLHGAWFERSFYSKLLLILW